MKLEQIIKYAVPVVVIGFWSIGMLWIYSLIKSKSIQGERGARKK